MTTTELLEFIDKEESSLLNEGESYYDVIHEDISVEEFCKKYKDILYGQYQVVKIDNKKYIANCFTQRNFITNLKDIEKAGLTSSFELDDFGKVDLFIEPMD